MKPPSAACWAPAVVVAAAALAWALPALAGQPSAVPPGRSAVPPAPAAAPAPAPDVATRTTVGWQYRWDTASARYQRAARVEIPLAAYPAGALPFAPGEELRFDFRWGIVDVGRGTLRVDGPVLLEDVPAWRVSFTVKTHGLANMLYRVENDYESFVSADGSRSLFHHKETDEAGDKEVEAILFDHLSHTARYRNRDGLKTPIEIPPGGVVDPLAIFLRLRVLQPVNGVAEQLVTDGEKLIRGRVYIKEPAEVRVAAGRFQAVRCQPTLQGIGGVFKHGREASMDVWVSTDARRLPLRIRGKVSVGTFEAELASYTPGRW